MNLKEKAEYCRIGIYIGLLDKADAIAWADAVIMAENEPDLAVIAASMCNSKRPEDVVAALGDVNGEADRNLVVGRIFKTMLDTVERDISQIKLISRGLEIMALSGYAPNAKAERYMVGVDDEFSLAENRVYGDVYKVTEELTDVLRCCAVRKLSEEI